MICKTRGIVLYTRKFGDSSLICSMYTREFGRKDFLIKGYRSTKGKKRHSYFQPMSILDIVFFNKETRELQWINESTLGYFFKTMQTDPVKIATGMAMMEVFSTVIREQERNDPLYEFLENTLVTLDLRTGRSIHIFIWFLLKLSAFAGFAPIPAEAHGENIFFDLKEGAFKRSVPVRNSDRILMELMEKEIDSCREVSFSNEDKKEMISTMLLYFKYHIDGFREPESMAVFKEIL